MLGENEFPASVKSIHRLFDVIHHLLEFRDKIRLGWFHHINLRSDQLSHPLSRRPFVKVFAICRGKREKR